MNGKRTERIAEVVRTYGTPDSPAAAAYVFEVRSDAVPTCPKPPPKGCDYLGAITIHWDFSLALKDVKEFHDFLRKNEKYIADSTTALVAEASYRGTYILLANGDVRYRTIWVYDSHAALASVWKKAVSKPTSNFYKAVKKLRQYWLRDPNRSEGRYIPAAGVFDDDDEPCEDSFGQLTLDAATS